MSESDIQKECVSWARDMANQHPHAYPLRWLYSVPNEAKRSYALANHLKAMGLTSGVADLCLPYPRHKGLNIEYCALYIEMKFEKNGLYHNQKKFKEYCESTFNAFETCWTVEEFQKTICWYLKIGDSK